jgi:hypothetical protein
MKTAEEKAKECIDNLIDSLSLEVNHEESNYDAGQVHALSDYGKEIYKVGFLEGQSNPKIKQLEWEWKSYIGYYAADTHLVDYLIAPEYGTDVNTKHLLWINKSSISIYCTLDEAKAAAQADFEARIKECLITE